MKENQFETIKRIDANGAQYWSSRDLAKVLEYADYRNFLTSVGKAKIACENSGEVIHNHFVDTTEMVKIGSGAEKQIFKIIKMLSKAKWILEKIEYFKSLGTFGKTLLPKPRISKKQARAHYLEHKEAACKLVQEKIEKFNMIYKFRYGTISIKNTKSRWGSCSRKGNLNFNYRLALLPERHAEYIVVHELCHLGQFNHSKKFWDLVEKTIPEYALIHRELRKHRFTLS